MDFEEEVVFKTASDKCLPYNKHNNSRIFTSTYEGIPENLLINFVGWLLLVILFAILRKNAWNYGRIALVQKAEGNNRWTQIFYGNVDEPENVSTDEGSLSSIDSSLFIEKGVYSWLTSVFKIKDRHILRKCGSDAVQYLAFQRHIIFYMTVIMVVSLGIVLPINFQGDLQGNEKTFGHTTLSNLKPDSQLLWAHVVLALLYVPLGIIVMRRFSLSVPLQKEDAHVSRTLLITNIPRVMCDKNDLERHFREAYPELGEDGVEDIQLAYDIAAISKLDHQREKAAQAVGYCESFCRTSGGQTLDMRPYVCGNSCCCCDIFGFAKIDAKEYYTEEEQRLSTQLEREKERVLQHPLGIVFVTLVSLEAAQRIYEDHTRSCKCSSNPSSSSLSRQLEPHNWMVTFAPEPSDIYWENLSVSFNYWYYKAFVINFILFVILFFLTTPTYVVNMLDTLKFEDEMKKMSPVLSEFLPTLLLWTVAALMPVLVAYTDQWLSHWTRSEQNHSVMRKTFIFLLFMVLILPSLGLTSAQAFVEWAVHPQNDTYRWECIFLPDKGAFFVNYVITSALIGTALELIRFPELFMYASRLCLAKSTAETASVRKAILYEFPFGVQYAWILLIFAMTNMYSLSCPLITPFGLLYMVLKHLVDKYNIYFAYGPSKISPSIHATAINCVIVSLVLLQCSFLSLSIVRLGLKDITLFSLAGFTLTIACFMAHIFLNCCRGFSPITYIKKSRREENADAIQHQSSVPDQHYVPAVLQHPSPFRSRQVSRSVPTTGYGTPTPPNFDTNSLPTSPALENNDPAHSFYQNTDGRYANV